MRPANETAIMQANASRAIKTTLTFFDLQKNRQHTNSMAIGNIGAVESCPQTNNPTRHAYAAISMMIPEAIGATTAVVIRVIGANDSKRIREQTG